MLEPMKMGCESYKIVIFVKLLSYTVEQECWPFESCYCELLHTRQILIGLAVIAIHSLVYY